MMGCWGILGVCQVYCLAMGLSGLPTAANVTSRRAPIRKNTCPRSQSLHGFPLGASSGDPALLFAPSGEVVMGMADSRASLLPILTGLQQSAQLLFWSLARGQGVSISACSLFLLPFHFHDSSANWPNRNSTAHCLQTSALALYLPKGLTGLLTRTWIESNTYTFMHSLIHSTKTYQAPPNARPNMRARKRCDGVCMQVERATLIKQGCRGRGRDYGLAVQDMLA